MRRWRLAWSIVAVWSVSLRERGWRPAAWSTVAAWYVCVCESVCVSVCVRERERERLDLGIRVH